MINLDCNIKVSRVHLSLIFSILIFAITLSAQNTWQSALVQIDTTTGQLSYFSDPVSGIRIPDFSRAGYKGGGVPFPDVPVRMTIDPISGDNTKHIQDAIDAVSAMPLDENGLRGTLLLNPGTYRVFGTLRITNSGVVLRGVGKGQDPANNSIILGLGNTPEDRAIIRMGGLTNTRFAGMVPGSKSNIISEKVEVGDAQFRVANPEFYEVGDNIIIKHPCTEKWLNAIDGGGTSTDESWSVDSQPIIYNTRIVRIECDTIFTNSPVFNTLDQNLSQSFIYIYDRAGLVENIGLESIRIDIEFNPNDPDDDNHAKRAVKVTQAENVWIENCEFLHFWYAGVDLETANYVTVENCNALSPKGPTTGGYKYNFCTSSASQNSLFINCTATEGRHAFVSNGTSSVAGIVFYNCTSIDPFTSSEGHRRWTTGLLFDNFVDTGNNPGRVLGLYNRGHWGTGHGWSSANSVAWNCDTRRAGSAGQIVIQRPPTAQNFSIGSKGNITGNGPYVHPAGYIEGSNSQDSLIPHSLYAAQLNSRIYNDSISRFSQTDFQYACDEFTWMDGVTYFENTNTPQFTLTDRHGNDSIVTLDLTFKTVDVNVLQDLNTLSATQSGARYQWLDCNNNFLPIDGEINQSFTAKDLGTYAVEIESNCCIDTSACFAVTTSDTDEYSAASPIEIFPSPSNGRIVIDLKALHSEIYIEVLDVQGQVFLKEQFQNSEKIELLLDLQPGLYFVSTQTSDNKRSIIKVVFE